MLTAAVIPLLILSSRGVHFRFSFDETAFYAGCLIGFVSSLVSVVFRVVGYVIKRRRDKRQSTK